MEIRLKNLYVDIWALNDHQRKNALILYQILLTDSLRRCMEIRLKNLYVDIWALNDRQRKKCFDPLSNSLNWLFKEMYGDQAEEFVCRYLGLRG